MSGVAFVDVETTGLDPDRHEVWEVALILPDGSEHEWQLPVDLSKADPIALAMNGFHARRWPAVVTFPVDHVGPLLSDPALFAGRFAALTRGLHLAGMGVAFDADRLWRLLRANGECPMWHYHLLDVEVLALGYLRGLGRGIALAGDIVCYPGALEGYTYATERPWKSTDLSFALGVNPDDFERHTAIGDARWAKACYDKIMFSLGVAARAAGAT